MYYRQAGESAPHLDVVDSRTGEDKTLNELLGAEPSLLYWIKTGCPVCQLAIPFVERIASKSDGNRVVVITQDEPAMVPAFRKEYGLETVPIYCEPAPFEAADQYGLTHVPTWFRVASDGQIVSSGAMFSQSELEENFQALGGEGSLFTDDEKSTYPATKPG